MPAFCSRSEWKVRAIRFLEQLNEKDEALALGMASQEGFQILCRGFVLPLTGTACYFSSRTAKAFAGWLSGDRQQSLVLLLRERWYHGMSWKCVS